MTTVPSSGHVRLVQLNAETLRLRLTEALDLYIAAMNYPSVTSQQRMPTWLAHMDRPGWRCVGAFSDHDSLIGICYGYQGRSGQWWHEQVRRGLAASAQPEMIETWLSDYFELTELHVIPHAQGGGIGERLLRSVLGGVTSSRVLLSTPEGPSKAWRLYRRLGFVDILRNYQFVGDSRPFGVLGRTLPL